MSMDACRLQDWFTNNNKLFEENAEDITRDLKKNE